MLKLSFENGTFIKLDAKLRLPHADDEVFIDVDTTKNDFEAIAETINWPNGPGNVSAESDFYLMLDGTLKAINFGALDNEESNTTVTLIFNFKTVMSKYAIAD